ncbi:MAG: SDR family oxidoreductase [Acidobacteriota bacterium]
MSRAGRARVALVTGGAVRLGRAIVEELASRGWHVAFTYRHSRQAADDLATGLARRGLGVEAVAAELADPSTWGPLVAGVLERHGRLDALVHNAALFPRTPFSELDLATWAALLRVNLEAPVFLTQAAAPALRAARGAVVTLLDIHGRFPVRSFLPYCISKAALEGATRALAVELAPEVRVNGIAPGIALFPDDTEQAMRQRQLARTLLGREGGATEIARAAAFLLEDAETITGHVLTIDGGRTVHLKE